VPEALFRMATLMADFVEANDFGTYATGLWLDRNTWDNERVNEVFVRAKAWLEDIRTGKP
jgi:hypothetical protein